MTSRSHHYSLLSLIFFPFRSFFFCCLYVLRSLFVSPANFSLFISSNYRCCSRHNHQWFGATVSNTRKQIAPLRTLVFFPSLLLLLLCCLLCTAVKICRPVARVCHDWRGGREVEKNGKEMEEEKLALASYSLLCRFECLLFFLVFFFRTRQPKVGNEKANHLERGISHIVIAITFLVQHFLAPLQKSVLNEFVTLVRRTACAVKKAKKWNPAVERVEKVNPCPTPVMGGRVMDEFVYMSFGRKSKWFQF